jgi:hypothetical protein
MIVEVNDSVFSYTALKIHRLKQFIQQNKKIRRCRKNSPLQISIENIHSLTAGHPQALNFCNTSGFCL